MENEKQHIRKTLLVAITSGATNLMSMTIYPHFKDRFTYLAIEKQEGLVSFLSHNDFTFDSLAFTTFGDFPDIEKRLLSYMDRFEEIILLSCLGRPVNAELTIRLAHFFSFQKKKVILVATLPFAFEGKDRITESLSVIKKMRTFPIILRLSIGERFLEGRDLDSLPFGEILEKVGEDIITLLEGICGNTNESDSQSLDEQIEYIEAYRDVAVSKAQSIRKYVEELAYGNTIFPTDTKIPNVDILTDDGENQSKPLEEYCDVYEIGWGIIIEPISWELIISFLAVDLLLLLSFFTGWDLVSFIILNICVVTLFCSWMSRRKKCNRWNKNMRLLIWNKTV